MVYWVYTRKALYITVMQINHKSVQNPTTSPKKSNLNSSFLVDDPALTGRKPELSEFCVTATVDDQAASVTVFVINPEGPLVVKVSVVIDTIITVVGVGEGSEITVTVEGTG